MKIGARQKFYKMHSLGNDFMVLDGVTHEIVPDPARIKAWSCRHTGIGFDQLLVIAPPNEPNADFSYLIFNADGSEAEQCGNGTRCVAALSRLIGLTKKEHLIWQSLAGEFETKIQGDRISTTMTVPEFDPPSIPFDPRHAQPKTEHSYTIEAANQRFEITPVSMGNPHAVIFVDELLSLDVETLGSALTDHAAFPQRSNIEFCQVVDHQFARLRVFERGVGETQACGTGACAAVAAARLSDRVIDRVKVSLPGGKLHIQWPGAGAPILMTGPANLIYEGEIVIR